MKTYNPIDYFCIVLLHIVKIFKGKKYFNKIYEKISSYIELRYIQTTIKKEPIDKYKIKNKIAKIKEKLRK